ncbi:MAG: enoyl-CoA hydratase-related protein [Myxococcales bacterium]|nr:enoyl-CoA hydratase/isomerase family protein [Myxococcales bacterium]HIK86486.1 enoyl-CoA hydratase/isomerase family protein [Myxococcales bacterium]
MSNYGKVIVSREESIAIVTLNCPEKLNAMDDALLRELLDAATKVNGDDSIRIVILTGAGRSFCAGADLKMKSPAGRTVEDHLNKDHRPVLSAIRSATKPWISAVNGAAAGIGSAYAMNCDLTVMADDAYLFQAFSAIGLVPDGGATWHLANTIGRKRTYELIATGEKLSAARCLDLGLCNRVVSAERLLEETLSWARKLAQRAPLSLRYAKAAVQTAIEHDLDTTFDHEAKLQMLCSASEDHVEGVAAFMQKRTPKFKGR